jgi:hypothetical protein
VGKVNDALVPVVRPMLVISQASEPVLMSFKSMVFRWPTLTLPKPNDSWAQKALAAEA